MHSLGYGLTASWRWLLSIDSEQWTAGATVATALVAGVAAVFAYQQVKHARHLREEQAQPVVVVDFQPHPTSREFMELVVRNSGQTIAHDVQFTFAPPLSSSLDDGTLDLNKSSMIMNGIPTMPPGKEHRALFDLMNTRYNDDTGRFDKDGHAAEYEVVVTFSGSDGKHYEPMRYRLSLDTYAGIEYIGEKTFNDFAKDFHDLARELKGTVKKGKLQVSAHDGDFVAMLERQRWMSWNAEAAKRSRRPQVVQPLAPTKYEYLRAVESRRHQTDVGRPRQRAGRKLRRIAEESRLKHRRR